MDIFNTAAVSCEIIYKILEAATSFRTESQSLAARFKYDARILHHFCKYFEEQLNGATALSKEDAALLEDSASYLGVLLKRVEVYKNRLEAQSRWKKEVNKITWVLRRNEVHELEKELYEWTKRLDLRLVALPERARTVISIGEEVEIQKFTPRLAASMRVEQFAAKAERAKMAIWEQLLVDSSRVEFTKNSLMAAFSSAIFEGRDAIVEFRVCPVHGAHDESRIKSTRAELGEFVAALNYLNSGVSGLLKCVGFFYEETTSPRFGLIYELPKHLGGQFTSFKDVVAARDAKERRVKLKYSLNHRLEFARKITAAVFFVHSLGWVHKAIRSQNIMLFDKEPRESKGECSKDPSLTKWVLSSPFLVGFEIARSNDGETHPGARGRVPLETGLYMHPDLHDPEVHVRHTMAHDVYSLGIILLELGIWSPLDIHPGFRSNMDPMEASKALLELAIETELLMGRRYREVVQFCISQGQEGDPGSVEAISQVLEKLEDLAQSV